MEAGMPDAAAAKYSIIFGASVLDLCRSIRPWRPDEVPFAPNKELLHGLEVR